jgi:recombinational DNA repair ATPase RecF
VLKQRNALLHAIKNQRAGGWGADPDGGRTSRDAASPVSAFGSEHGSFGNAAPGSDRGGHTTSAAPGTQHTATSWESELNIWDEQLVEHGSYLMLERAKTVKYFQENLASTYQKISSGTEKVSIHYHHTIHTLLEAEISASPPAAALADFADSAASTAPAADFADRAVPAAPAVDSAFAASTIPVPPLEIWREHFARALAASRARDIQALVTTTGPHRDDLDFSFDGLRLASRASRGEYRSLLLALKLIELNFFEDRSGNKPILLLDDVFSELDPGRQNLLLQAIQGHQTIITATHLDQEPFPRTHRDLAAVGLQPAITIKSGAARRN